MIHDEFCPTPDPDASDCAICMLLRMARRDEQDKHSGDEEMDREAITQDAYARGYEAASRARVAIPAAPVQSVSPDTVGKYIKDRMSTLSMQEVNTLYGLYQFLGGK